MADPVADGGAVEMVEDAVHLLRQAPLETWVCYWAGSVPFALAALRFWNDATNPRMADSACALESLGLALLLVWMNCWRAVFAGKLRAHLGGAGGPPWTARRLWNLVAGQAFFGATRLAVAPLAGLIVFPLAGTVAFYRTTAVLGGHEDLAPLEVMAKARRLASARAPQSWALLPILAFLYLLVAINLGIVLAVLPQLVRMLTGYESAFSRSGIYYIVNPLFVLLLVLLSWIAIDPLVQAVYCVRAFRAESMATGEDLRVGIRRIAGLLLLLAVLRPASAVTPDELERSIHQAMQSPEYSWRLPPPAAAPANTSTLERLADRMISGVQWLYEHVGDALSRLFKWLFRGNAEPVPGAPPSTGLHWSLYVLIGAVVLGAVWMAWRWRRSRRAKATVAGAPAVAVRLDAQDLSADRLPEERWIELAEQSLREGSTRLALRAFYLASLAWLGRSGFLAIDSGKTNREYEIELQRKARPFPEARGLFGANVTAFERAWYGMHEVCAADVGEFQRRFDGMKTSLAVPEGAGA